MVFSGLGLFYLLAFCGSHYSVVHDVDFTETWTQERETVALKELTPLMVILIQKFFPSGHSPF